MYFDYLNVLLFASVGFFFVFLNVAVGSLIRPKRDTDEGLETYECGEPTTGDTWIKFDIRYYTVALVYVVFAVEIAFLFPWAIVLGDAIHDTGKERSTSAQWPSPFQPRSWSFAAPRTPWEGPPDEAAAHPYPSSRHARAPGSRRSHVSFLESWAHAAHEWARGNRGNLVQQLSRP